MKRFFAITALTALTANAYAQQEMLQSQYMFNGLFINPAYAGSHNFAEATALYRTQWTGLDGAPKTQTFGLDSPISDGKMGLGLSVINDKIGDTRQTEVFANWSYHLSLDEAGKTKMSFGIRAGFSDYNADLSQTKVFDGGDPIFSQNVSHEFVPKFGAGVYFYSRLWYAGLSIPTLYAADDNVRLNINENSDRYFKPHTYLTAGYVFEINDDLALKPSFLLRYLKNTPLQADINCNLLVKNVFWIGASYRTGDAVIGILEYNIYNLTGVDLRLGYSYDFTTSRLNMYSNGSHEVMLSFRFNKEPIKTRTPRYF